MRGLVLVKMVAMLLATALLLGAAAQAMPAMAAVGSCRTAGAAPGSDMTATCHACPAAPANAPMPGDCVWMAGCPAGAAFDIPASAAGPAIAERRAPTYWVTVVAPDGRTIAPELLPPIATA